MGSNYFTHNLVWLNSEKKTKQKKPSKLDMCSKYKKASPFAF